MIIHETTSDPLFSDAEVGRNPRIGLLITSHDAWRTRAIENGDMLRRAIAKDQKTYDIYLDRRIFNLREQRGFLRYYIFVFMFVATQVPTIFPYGISAVVATGIMTIATLLIHRVHEMADWHDELLTHQRGHAAVTNQLLAEIDAGMEQMTHSTFPHGALVPINGITS